MKRVCAGVVMLSAMIMSLSCIGDDIRTCGDFKWRQDGAGATITDYTGNDVELVIPSEIDGFPVTSIGDSAFEGCKQLQSVVLPRSLNRIGTCAFMSTGLRSITFKSGSTYVDSSAFYWLPGTIDLYCYANMPRFEESITDCDIVFHVDERRRSEWEGRTHDLQVVYEHLDDDPEPQSEPQTYYVASSGDDAADGKSQATAFRTIQRAVDAADERDEILVGEGSYAPFVCTGKVVRVKSLAGPEKTVITGSYYDGDVYFYQRAAQLDAAFACPISSFYYGQINAWARVPSTVLDGFTLCDGYAGADQYGNGYNGGCVYGGELTNCVITGGYSSSSAGGAWGSSMVGCRICDNNSYNFIGGAGNCFLDSCIVRDNVSDAYEGGIGSCVAVNCMIIGNESNCGGGGAANSVLYNCTVTKNSCYQTGGGVFGCKVYNSIVWGNEGQDETTANWDEYDDGWAEMQYSCTSPLYEGGGNIADDPLLADDGKGSFGIARRSPCVDAGSEMLTLLSHDFNGQVRVQGNAPDMGATEGGLDGCFVQFRIAEGCGTVPEGFVCDVGESVEIQIAAASASREIESVSVNGEKVLGLVVDGAGKGRFTLTPTGDVTVDVNFKVYTHYVSPDGNDVLDGSSWTKAKRTIQEATGGLYAGDIVLVTNGTYGAFKYQSDTAIEIRSVNGPLQTIIDGGGVDRCVQFAGHKPILEGFTIQRGCTNKTDRWSHWAGVYHGHLRQCILKDNDGAPAKDSWLENCLLTGNRCCASYKNSRLAVVFSEGGNSGSSFSDFRSFARNCTIAGNVCDLAGSYAMLENCIVFDNVNAEGTAVGLNNTCHGDHVWTDDPDFVDSSAGDYRLSSTSPCIDAGTDQTKASWKQPEIDLADSPRIIGNAIDIGCFEHYPTYVTVPFVYGSTGWTWNGESVSAATVSNHTDIAVVCEADLEWPADRSAFIVCNGTFKVLSAPAVTCAITVEEGARFDLNGIKCWNMSVYFDIVLNGGELTNTSEVQATFKGLTLTRDSFVDVPSVGEGISLQSSAGTWADITVDMNGHALTKRGGGTLALVNARFEGGGEVNVTEGRLYSSETTVFGDAVLRVGEKGIVSQRANYGSNPRTLDVGKIIGEGGNLDILGTITNFTLEGTVALASFNRSGTITMAEDAVLNVGQNRNLTLAGAGTVNVVLTDAEIAGGAGVTVFTPSGEATTRFGKVTDSNGNAVSFTSAGGVVTVAPDNDCITFTSDGGFTLKTANLAKNWDVGMQWSTDKVVWTEWNGEEVSAAQQGGAGSYSLYVRGDENTVVTGEDGWDKSWVLTPAGVNTVACSGNIETLRGATGDGPSPTPMADHCYYVMFWECASLTTAPVLPATTLAVHCYGDMFAGCTSLMAAPALPATVLAAQCYDEMFCDCTSLTTAPVLPATTLAESCYGGMFWDCTSLTAAPALLATALADYCYECMFAGCTSLTAAPALPATALARQCYDEMFMGCTSLTAVPDLPATALARGCYEQMFFLCTGIRMNAAAPGKEWSVPAGATAADDWNRSMFYGTGGDFTGAPEIGTTYYIQSAVATIAPQAVEHATFRVYTNEVEVAAPYTVIWGDTVKVVYTADAGYFFAGGSPTAVVEVSAKDGVAIAPTVGRETATAVLGADKYFSTFAAAVAEAKNGDTVRLLKNASGDGIFIGDDRFPDGLTVDLGGFAYTVTGNLVGGVATTRTQALHLGGGNVLSFVNGTVAVAADAGALMLVQNYSSLTLTGVTLDGRGLLGSGRYVFSNNNGEILIGSGSQVLAKAGGWAFDVCVTAGYEGARVTVDGATINGDVQVSCEADGDDLALDFVSGTLDGRLDIGSGGDAVCVTKSPAFELDPPDGCSWSAPMRDGRQMLVEPGWWLVDFDLTKRGTRNGGGRELQRVANGGTAVLPTVTAQPDWVFSGWSCDFAAVTNDLTVTALYRTLKADLHVDEVVVTNAATSGDAVAIRWTVGNTGNPGWNGRVTEAIRLVSTTNAAQVVTVWQGTTSLSVPRDGTVGREYVWTIPLKGYGGVWRVVVETAIGASNEFGGDNARTAAEPLVITPCPLPELCVASVALEEYEDPDCGLLALRPGNKATLRYGVKNIGAAPVTKSRTDALYVLDHEDGVADATRPMVRLATWTVAPDDGVESDGPFGTVRVHDIIVDLPKALGMSGDVRFHVMTDIYDAVAEQNEADEYLADEETYEHPIYVFEEMLFVEPATPTVAENNSSGVRVKVTRSGFTDQAKTVAVSAGAGLAVPSAATFAKGSSVATFYAKPVDNALVDGNRTVEINVGEYAADVTIVDNEVPRLSVSLDKTLIKEGGGVITATLTRELATSEPLTVYLTGVSSSHCTYPASVVIPANETTVTFEITPVDNDTAEIAANLTLRASANGHVATSVSYVVEDDDVPTVTLELYPEEVSEGAGAAAAYAILSRTDQEKIGEAITVNLTQSPANQLILQTSVTIPAYTMAVRFPIGVVDNGADDGDRDVVITGSIYIKSCGCSGQPSSGDVIEATLRVIDNDVPSLTLVASPSTMKEGLAHAGDLILTHNSVLAEDLDVELSFDTAGEIDIPAVVTIPAGETQVVIPVRTIDDGVTDGGKLVSVYADDPNGDFASASTWIQVSDQNLPDLKVVSVTSVSEAFCGSPIDVTCLLANAGFVDVTSSISYSIHLVKDGDSLVVSDDNRVGNGIVNGFTGMGESVSVMHTVLAPALPGRYVLLVKIDPDNLIAELDDANNTAIGSALNASATYRTAVGTDRETYERGSNVSITGAVISVDGRTPVGGQAVRIGVGIGGFTREEEVCSASDGTFSAVFTPYESECGHYIVTAGYPGDSTGSSSVGFDIVGLSSVSASYPTVELTAGDTKKITCKMKNPSNIDIDDLSVAFDPQPASITIAVDGLPDSIKAQGALDLSLDLCALSASPNVNWEMTTVKLSSGSKTLCSFPLKYHVDVPTASLQPSVAKLDTSATIGERRYLTFELQNQGRGASGVISFKMADLPWMRIISAKQVGNLSYGESAVVQVEIAPPSGLKPNVPYSGSFVISPENGNDVEMPFRIVPVMDKVGSFLFDVTDIQTSGGGPHVADASIEVFNTALSKKVAEGITAQDGTFLLSDVPAGVYTATVSAPQHATKTLTIDVAPGTTTRHIVFLEYSAVNYSFTAQTVKETDAYNLTLIADYNTTVPLPVLKIEVPGSIPDIPEGGEHVFAVKVWNDGLINITDVRIEIDGQLGDLEAEQITPVIACLSPKSSAIVYIRLTNPKEEETPRLKVLSATAKGNEDDTPYSGHDPYLDLDEKAQNALLCTIGLRAIGNALCGEKGIRLMSEKQGIRKFGQLCNMAALLMSQININPFDSGSSQDEGDGREREVVKKQTRNPQIVVPVESEGTYDCECLINALDKICGAFVNQVPGMDIVDALERFSASETPCDLLKAISSMPAPSGKEALPYGSVIGQLTSVASTGFDLYDKCKSTAGDSVIEKTGKTVNETVKNAKKLVNQAARISEMMSGLMGKDFARKHQDKVIVDFINKKWLMNAKPSSVSYGELNDYLRSVGEQATTAANFWRIFHGMKAIADFAGGVCDFMDFLEDAYDVDLSAHAAQQVASLPKLTAASDSAADDAESGIDPNDNPYDIDIGAELAALKASHEELLSESGCSSLSELYEQVVDELTRLTEGEAMGVCTKVRIKFAQSMTFTREVVEGTLTVSNGENRDALTNLKFELSVTDQDGNECLDRLFGHRLKSTSGLADGDCILSSGSTLASGGEGDAVVVFVPTPEAAPVEDTLYYFGGYISYHDETTGEDFRAKLTPVPLVVRPSCYLHVDYFLQRDVYGDNPFTSDVVEPSEPAELAMIVRNVGSGLAMDVNIASAQPSTIENDQGLKVDFVLGDYQLDSAALNGQTKYVSLGNVALGDIESGTAKVAQWWLISSIEGHFSDPVASVTHLNAYYNVSTSLVDPNVGRHMLVRSFDADGDDLPDFLTCDEDLFGDPTEIYLASGDGKPIPVVHFDDSAVVCENGLIGKTVQLTVNAAGQPESWNYLSAAVEGLDRYIVRSVVDEGGNNIDVRRVWITDRIFKQGSAPLRRDRIHVVDWLERDTRSRKYTVTLVAKPTDGPSVVEIAGIPDEMSIDSSVDSVLVRFSTSVDVSTFTVDDLKLVREGETLGELSGLGIAPVGTDGMTFKVSGLTRYQTAYGYYELVVQAAEICDVSGTFGAGGKSAAWLFVEPMSPTVASCTGFSSCMANAVDSVVVTFSEPIDVATMTRKPIGVNGVACGEEVRIVAIDGSGTRFEIKGLSALQPVDGDYVLSIDMSQIKTAAGVAGQSAYSASWTLDTVPVAISDIASSEVPGGVRYRIEFTEDVTATSAAGLSVLLNGIGVPHSTAADGRVVTVTIDNALFDSDGEYEIAFDATGVVDAAGNACCSQVARSTLLRDTTPPEQAVDLGVSPDTGLAGDGVTSADTFVVTGRVFEAGVDLSVFCQYPSGTVEHLADTKPMPDLTFSVSVSPAGVGAMSIIVRQTDKAGLECDTLYPIFIDSIALDASFSGLPDAESVADAVVLTFTAEPTEASVLAAPIVLTRNGEAVEMPNAALTKVSALAYSVSGLAEYTADYGDYELSCDLSGVAKALSGLTGGRTVSASWSHVQLDTVAPTVAAVLFDGEAAVADYVQMFSSVAVRFSESVNVPDLIARDLIGQALFFQVLDDDNAVLETVRATGVTWDESTHTASWTVAPDSIPCGKARLVIDPFLIRDASGNALVTTDAFDVISTSKSYVPSPFMSAAATESACPTLFDYNNDGLLDLFVGEKASDTVGKVRIYLNRGTKTNPVFSDWTYLKRGTADVEVAAAGCSGAQVSFRTPRGSSNAQMVLASSIGEVYVWRYNVLIGDEPAPLVLWHDSSMNEDYRPIRTQTFCSPASGGKILVSGQNSRMFWLSRVPVYDANGETVSYRRNYSPLLDKDGKPLDFPEGQNHTAAVMTDVSGDSVLDLVTGDSDGNVWVYCGMDGARFVASPVKIYENTSGITRSRLAVGDVDGDGIADILVGRRDGSVIKLKGESVLAQAVNFRRYRVKGVEEALSTEIYWENAAHGWVSEQTRDDAQATVDRTAGQAETVLTAKFVGAGTLSFSWSFAGSDTSSRFRCEVDGATVFDREDAFEMTAEATTVFGSGTHTVVWRVSGVGKAILRDVGFIPADAATQYTATSEKPIAYKDIRAFANKIWKEKGGDYEAAVKATAANGKSVYENCITGVDSSDPDGKFLAKIEIVDGVPQITPSPDLGNERTYATYGRASLQDGEWILVTPENKSDFKFFRVAVELEEQP